MKCRLFFLLLFAPLLAIANDGEIRIQLTTKQPLKPLYLGEIQSDQSLSKSHLAKIAKVLSFDLANNGRTKIVPRDDVKENLLRQEATHQAFAPRSWQTFCINYVVKPTIENKKLRLSLFAVQKGAIKHFDIPLSGTLARDRKEIHRACDGIHHVLFGKPGIAHHKILYSSQKRDPNNPSGWSGEIWECDWDGKNAHAVTKDKSYCVTPIALARAKEFLYVSYRYGQPKLFLGSRGQNTPRQVLSIRGNQLLPALSQKRDKIAFICDAAGREDLFIQSFHPQKGVTGKPVQLFSFPRSSQGSPTFSPDGSKIAFVSNKDGSPRIYTIPTITSRKRAKATLIAKKNRESSCPDWSPDGTKLAYSAKTNGVRQIWIYDFEDKEEYQLTFGPGNKENPAWAPDSLHLVFNSTDHSSSDLYIVNLNQPDAIKISSGHGNKHYPTWVTD